MSERYVITGAQLGMFEAFAKMEDESGAKKLIAEIIDKQFIGNSKQSVVKDAQDLSARLK